VQGAPAVRKRSNGLLALKLRGRSGGALLNLRDFASPEFTYWIASADDAEWDADRALGRAPLDGRGEDRLHRGRDQTGSDAALMRYYAGAQLIDRRATVCGQVAWAGFWYRKSP
jgi:hypothetical protein